MPDAPAGGAIGEAVTWMPTLVRPESPAALIASDLGRPVYERMGFVALLRFTLWIAIDLIPGPDAKRPRPEPGPSAAISGMLRPRGRSEPPRPSGRAPRRTRPPDPR